MSYRINPLLVVSSFVLVASTGCFQVLGLNEYGEGGAHQGGASSTTTSSTSTGNPTTSSSTSTSSSTGSSSSSSSSGPGSSSSSGTGGAPPVCNSLTDICAPATPLGWAGPVALYEGPGNMAPPACVGDYGTPTPDLFAGLNPGNPTCGCTCDAAQGIVCSAPATLCFNNNCILLCNTTSATLPPNTCTTIPTTTSTQAHVFIPAPVNMGSCAHHATNMIPPPQWATRVRGCSGATTTPQGCLANQICAPLPASPFDKLCIEHTGDMACADPFYNVKHLVTDGADDTRSCSACDCGPASSSCAGKVDFTESNCTILDASVSGSCGPKNNGTFIPNGANYMPMPSGSCQPLPTSGQVQGTVTEHPPITFCCHG